MKKAFLLIAILFTCNALAKDPKIGDRVFYQNNFSVEGAEYFRTVEKTITAHDVDKDTFLIHVTSKMNSSVRDYEFLYRRSALPYLEKASLHCKSFDGTKVIHYLEEIEVPAGKFLACRTERSFSEGTIITEWHASEVPFGLLKQKIDGPAPGMDETVLAEFTSIAD